MVREASINLEAQARRLARQLLEQPRRDEPAHAAAGIEHDVERLDERRIDEAHHVIDIGVERVGLRHRAAHGGRRRNGASGDHVTDVRDAFLTRQRERLAAHHLHAVVLLRVVRRRHHHAAVMAVLRHGEVEHVSGNHPVVDDVAALRGGTVDEGLGDRGRRQAHVAANRDALRLEVGDERRADGPRRLLVHLVGVGAANVVRLEDVRVDRDGHGRSCGC